MLRSEVSIPTDKNATKTDLSYKIIVPLVLIVPIVPNVLRVGT
jgi:hypothetical protein